MTFIMIPQKTFYAPNKPDFVANPYPFYEQMRKTAPFYYISTDYWIVTCYENIAEILSNKNFGKCFIYLIIKQADKDKKLKTDAVVANIILLFLSGYEFVINFISNSVFALYKHPDKLQWFGDNLNLMKQALHELVRYESPLQS